MKKYLFSMLLLVGIFGGCTETAEVSTLATYGSVSTNTSTNTITLEEAENIEITHVRTVGINGTALDITLSHDGNYAYVASGDAGLQVIDISDPWQAKLIYTPDYTYDYVNRVEIQNNLLYLSYVPQSVDDYRLTFMYDVGLPYKPTYLESYEGYTTDTHEMVETENHTYYISNYTLFVINNTTDAYNSYPLYDPQAIALRGKYIFVANGREGVTILKVDTPITSKYVAP